MKGVLVSVAICLSFLLPTGGTCLAGDLTLGIDAGVSRVTGQTYGDYFDAGYAVGGNIFYNVHENISIGGRARYHRWNAADRFREWWRAEGSTSILEIVPAVRFHTRPESIDKKVLLFVELGAGYVTIDSDAVAWMVPDLPEDPVGPQESVIDSQSNTVLSLGGGISIDSGIGFCIEFIPVFEYIFTDADALMHVSANLGLSLGI
jgi:hypothetical protein